MKEIFDIGIIGGGPAGYTAALHAAKNGSKVILFEKESLGGVCLNKGCIPTKSILHSSELFKKFKNAQDYGIICENITPDWSKIIERKNNTVEKLRKGIELALKNTKVHVVNSEAEIINPNEISAGENTYFCNKIICAIGSSPRLIKGLEFDHKILLSSDDILQLDKLPSSILIIGSGAIGIEWARIMSNFGVQTTVIELAPYLLPIADIEVSKRIERIFKSEKITFYTETSVDKVENSLVTLSDGTTVQAEKILVAIGRTPNQTKKINGVTYIGDVCGETQLAHYAIKQAIETTDNINFTKSLTPSIVYGSPEVAWVGKKEQDLEPDTYKKSLILISSLGKAQCDGETEGFIKILSQENQIVGAHIVSAEASSLIQQLVIAIQNNITTDKLREVCFAHPTYSEGIFEALFK